jgi:hypothetical protein
MSCHSIQQHDLFTDMVREPDTVSVSGKPFIAVKYKQVFLECLIHEKCEKDQSYHQLRSAPSVIICDL